MKTALLLPFLLAAAGCHAAQAEEPQKFVGKFAFNWLSDPSKQTCKPVTAAFASALSVKRFACKAGEVSTEAGLKPIACGDPGQKVQYLLFDTKKDCENERRNQAANE